MKNGECRYCSDKRDCWAACLDLLKRNKSEVELTKDEKEKVKNYNWANTMQSLDSL